MSEKAYRDLAKQYRLSVEQIQELLKLLGSDASTSHVLRYRKDLAANLTADDLEMLRRESLRLDGLERERRQILRKLEEQGVLTDELRQKINATETISELIDCYVPFRPRKRSRSRLALAQGLEPLARRIFTQDEVIPAVSAAAEPHVDPAKGLPDVGEVLDGTFHIVCDWIAEEKSHRDKQRQVLKAHGTVASSAASRSVPPGLRGEFRDYLSLELPLGELHPYHVLSLMRGKRLKVLAYAVEPPLAEMCRTAADLYLRGGAEQFSQIDVQYHETQAAPEGAALGELTGAEFLYWCIRCSLSNVLVPILTRETERELRNRAEDLAGDIVRRNLRSQLMVGPVRGHRVLGMSPGYRTGCKLAALDETGGVLETDIVYPHTPRFETDQAKQRIAELVEKHKITVAAIGDGTARQETENLMAELIADRFPDLRYAILSEKAAASYAGCSLADRELPGLDRGIQTAVSLGRQLLDPLQEFTKVNIRDLCPARYVQEVDNQALERIIRRTTEECVAEVGADLNAAPRTLLKYVPGLDSTGALEVVRWREQKGRFANRTQLREVPKVDEKIWQQAAGFVRVLGSDNPLDATRIHPDYYPVATAILEQLGFGLEDLRKEEARKEIARKCGEVRFAEIEKRFGVHYLWIKDMLAELAEPWPDPRARDEGPVLRRRPLTFGDLQPGEALYGTVRKVVDFGAFVDIGVSEDGLVHISELSDEFVRSPHDVVSIGDTVKVRVVEVDPEKRRIALSMRSQKTARKGARPPRESVARTRPEKRPHEPAAVPQASGKGAVQAPQSTLGKRSRRVQKLSTFTPKKKDQGKAPAAAPAPERKSEQPARQPQEKDKEKPERIQLHELLSKLDFAAIEKRGEQRQ